MRFLSIVLLFMYFSMGTMPAVPLTNNAAEPAEILIVQKRIGTDNRYEVHKEITEPQDVTRIQRLLEEEKWSQAKIEWQTPPAYKLSFQPTDGREAKAIIYDVWFTNGFAEIYIAGLHKYKKLSLKDSAVLEQTLTP